MLCSAYPWGVLQSFYFIRAWAFLTLANFKLYCLAFVQCCVFATSLNFRVVNKEVFAAIFGGDKAKAFVGVKPLNCTFTHIDVFMLR
jgi:hypothetical protein